MEAHGRGLLTGDEQARAGRFHFVADRRRFTVTRAILRALLGRYLDAAPGSLRFELNEFGKPSLVRSQNPRGIHFNVAHSGDCSLLAFGLATHLGVDVEYLQVTRDVVDVAQAVFSAAQYESFLALPEGVRKKSFFDTWARKEAIVKALGVGLSLPLNSLEVEEATAPEWFVRNLEMDGPYVAAIAVKARKVELFLWNWQQAS
jgi:4'-phosphopantetheinyl transferase